MLNSTESCAKRRDDDSFLTKNHALSSRVGHTQGLRNPVFLSVASQANSLTRWADAKYGKWMPSVGNGTLFRDMHAGATLSPSQKARVTGAFGEMMMRLISLLFRSYRYGEYERNAFGERIKRELNLTSSICGTQLKIDLQYINNALI